jgi:hypothetical protein
MEDACLSRRFDDLPLTEQHTVDTYFDELTRRDTVVDQRCAGEEDEVRDSRVYSIPSAEHDRQGVSSLLALLQSTPH